MTMLLNCCGLKKEFGERTVLKEVTFDITFGERIGLVGINGAGKTTLVNILAGKVKSDGGTVLWHKKNIKIGYLKQGEFYTESVVTDYNEKRFLKISSNLGLEKVYNWGEEKIKNLSGGERTKLAIANIWSLSPDFLVLDEPTNHLDYKGVQWLITELRRYKGTILVISHDRYFLDEIVNRILELEDGSIRNYNGNYSFYGYEKKRTYEEQLNQYKIQEERKLKIREQIENLISWSAKAHRDAPSKAAAAGNKKGGKEFLRSKAKKMDIQIKSRIKRLEKIQIEGVAKPKVEKETKFSFKDSGKRGSRVIEAVNIKKTFSDMILFKNSYFYVQRGEKIGILGDNGCGKTTLLKLLLGEYGVDEGNFFLSPSLKIGYLNQELSEGEGKKTIIDAFEYNSKEARGSIQTILYNMGFQENMLSQRIGTLSLGEITRLKLAKLIVEECNLLILDEPSNHLDIHGREKLEEVIENYDGTVMLVSHDRYMLERLCSKLLVFENGRIKRLEYSLSEHLDKKIDQGNKNEEKLLIENQIAVLLGELCGVSKGSIEYEELDKQYYELMARKKELI